MSAFLLECEGKKVLFDEGFLEKERKIKEYFIDYKN